MNVTPPLADAQSSELRESPPPKTISDLQLGPLWEVRLVQWMQGTQKVRYNQLSDEAKRTLRNQATHLSIADGVETVRAWREQHHEPYKHNMPTALVLFEEALLERGVIKTRIRAI